MTPDEQNAYNHALAQIEECLWTGIPILQLELGLTRLPPEIGKLTLLTKLELFGNKLASLPPEIGNLTSLTELGLSSNQLASLPPEIGNLSALTELDLNSNQLTTLPREIGNLSALTELYLYDNQLAILPPEIGNLSALTLLNLEDNQLVTLPGEIGNLSALTDLYLSGNRLTTLPPEICNLSALKELHLAGNRLDNLRPEIGSISALTILWLQGNKLVTLPQEIGKLSSLTVLHLHNNQLIALPSEIGNLSALTALSLEGNQLTALPPEIGNLSALTELWVQNNQLRSLPNALQRLPGLKSLFLHGNRALRLSATVLGANPADGARNRTAAKTILNYYFGAKLANSRPLNELKLILVGRGGAGKTSTANALRGLKFQEGEKSTPGIALCDWKMDGCKGEPVTAHVWDFAGQVITHALHQFFFSTRCVYVVVLTGRENSEKQDAEYWLRLIKAFGSDDQGNGPPVIIALNKWDVPGCRPKIDRGALQERYPFIRAFVEMDCKAPRKIAKLKAVLYREVSRLKWVREQFPPVWDKIRRELTSSNGRKRRAHMTYSEYRDLCAKHGLTEEDEQNSLSDILHNLGAALNYRNDPRLREATVLLPDWLTSNVYSLMRRAEKQAGTLKQDDIDAVLKKEKDEAMRKYLVHLMERFEIAYAPKSSSGPWLVPQALPDTQPTAVPAFHKAAATGATRLRYTYKALPEGLVARAIVRLHDFIEIAGSKRMQWASGAILTREGARALIVTDPQGKVVITVIGPEKARQQLAGLCQAEMRDIHDDIRGLEPLEETEIHGDWISIATLETDEKLGQKTGVSTFMGTLLVDPTETNNAFSERIARIDDIWKPTVFISYSKSNITQRKRLEQELKMLMNEGLIARTWHDRMIDPGDRWDSKIQSELACADIVIVMVSAAALSTDYITQHEIPKAMELNGAGKIVVVPLILEKCRWDKTALGALNALPEKAKPLNTWNPQSNAWITVSDGLAVVCNGMMEDPFYALQSPKSEKKKLRRQ